MLSQRTWVSFTVPIPEGLKVLISPDAGELIPSSGLWRHLHSHVFTHTHTKRFLKINQGASGPRHLMDEVGISWPLRGGFKIKLTTKRPGRRRESVWEKHAVIFWGKECVWAEGWSWVEEKDPSGCLLNSEGATVRERKSHRASTMMLKLDKSSVEVWGECLILHLRSVVEVVRN